MPEVQNGAQSPIFRLSHLHGTAALVHEDAYHMAVPITWQCGGQPCHQLLLINMEDKSISREWPTVRKMVKVWENFKLQSEAPWLLGCNRWPLLQMRYLQPGVFTREGGGAGFFNWQTCVLHGAGRFKSTYNIVNRHNIAEYS